MPTLAWKPMNRQDWALGTSWRWGWNTTNEAYAGHTNTYGYYVTLMEFTTPNFTGVVTQFQLGLYAKRSYGSTPGIRIAIVDNWSENASRYFNTKSTVTDSHQLAQRQSYFNTLGTSYARQYFTFNASSLPGLRAMKPNTTYYVWLWAEATNENAMLGTAGNHGFYLSYDQGLARIDNGSSIVTAVPYVDDGTKWVRAMPYIDDGSTFKLGV